METKYICPICKTRLVTEDNSLRCSNNHCFDISAEGYVNLAGAKKTNTDLSGDATDTCRARRRFLEAGYYRPLGDKICECLKSIYADLSDEAPLLIDAGCGEGYYSRVIKNTFPKFDIYGIDLAKQGIKMAAKFQKNFENKNNYSVSGIFDMPFEDQSAAAVLSVFAPISDKESLRVLKKDGLLIVACPGKEHLYGLKEALYEKADANVEKIPEYNGFTLVDTITLQYTMTLDGEAASDLFAMTPYYWRSSKDIRQKSENLNNVTTDAHFIIKVYKKN